MTKLNPFILDKIKGYPTDGTFKYGWDSSSPYAGVTQDLSFENIIIARSSPEHDTFCCGITFEVWLLAALEAGIKFKDADQLKAIRRDFFIVTKESNPKGCVYALTSRDLGEEVSRKEAKAGDLAQIWRENGSGHTVILTDIIISNVDYWSTQKKGGYTTKEYRVATNGIGYRKEYFDKGYSPIKDIYIVRPILEV